MSVIVKDMDMPKNCQKCFMRPSDCWFFLNWMRDSNEKENAHKNRLKGCPHVALPENHGRLIDADAFMKYLEEEFADGYENDQKSDADMKMLIAKMHELIITEIRKRPTVVESEEQE